jgi:hypothetical protein
MRGTKVVQGRMVVRCPYPDCQGEVLAGEPFCEECGRSLAPTAVAAAKAGMATRGSLPGVPSAPGNPSHLAPPFFAASEGSPARSRSGNGMAPATVSPVPWLMAGLLVLFLLSVLAFLGLVALGATRTRAPAATPTPRTLTFTFQLSDLTAANTFTAAQEVQAADGARLGLLSLHAGYSYAQQGSPELLGTVEVRANDAVMLELAASAQPAYAQHNSQYAVAQANQTYIRTTAEGWAVRVTVLRMALDERPRLATGTTGPQPVFTTLTLQVVATLQ